MKSISTIVVVLSFLATPAFALVEAQEQSASAKDISKESAPLVVSDKKKDSILSDREKEDIKAIYRIILPMHPCPADTFPKVAVQYGEEGSVMVLKKCIK